MPPDTGVAPGVNPRAPSAKRGEMNFPAHVARAWWGGASRHPTHQLWGRAAPRALRPPNTTRAARAGLWGRRPGDGAGEALVWAGTTPTEAVPTDRRTLIPWRLAGVASGSCSCSATGAAAQVAGRPAGGHVGRRCGRGPTLLPSRSAIGPHTAPDPRWRRGRGSRPSQAAIGEAQTPGLKDSLSSQWGSSGRRWRWARCGLTSPVSNEALPPPLAAGEGPGWEKEPHGPPGRPSPIGGLPSARTRTGRQPRPAQEEVRKPPTSLEEMGRIMRLMPEQAEWQLPNK